MEENNKLKEEFKKVFGKAYCKELTDTEVEEIIINLSGLFKSLRHFNTQDAEEKNKLENKNGIQ